MNPLGFGTATEVAPCAGVNGDPEPGTSLVIRVRPGLDLSAGGEVPRARFPCTAAVHGAVDVRFMVFLGAMAFAGGDPDAGTELCGLAMGRQVSRPGLSLKARCAASSLMAYMESQASQGVCQ